MDDRQPDMFGHEAPSQGALFEEPEPAPPPFRHTKETIRERMLGLLDRVRDAEVMPFTARDQRSHLAMFPYMAEWLKDGEGDRLLAEFRGHMERLSKDA